MPHVVFLLGLSGSGKTTVAELMAQELGFLHLDIDVYGASGITAHGLDAVWATFRAGDATPLAATLRRQATTASARGIVLSFPSMLMTREQLDVATSAGIVPLVLHGTASLCLQAFLEREAQNGRALDERHWWHFNEKALDGYERPEYSAVRLPAFTPDGRRWSRVEWTGLISERLGLPTA